MLIDGQEVTAELVELSVGCHEHGAPLCLLLRTDDGRDLHIPGRAVPATGREDDVSIRFSRRLGGAGFVRHGLHDPVYRPQLGVFLPGGWGVVASLRPHRGWRECHGLPGHR